jgi:predicted metal-dependent hydrolase
MATKQVTIPSIGTVTLYKRRGNRSLRLSVGANGEVRVSLPYWVPYKAAEEFAKGKASWILANQTKRNVLLAHGQHIGKAHRVFFQAESGRSTVSTRVDQTDIIVHHPPHMGIAHDTVQAKAQAAGVRALRQESERLLPQRLEHLARDHGFTYKSVGVKQLKSRWGSCTSHQEIVLNLFLMQLPWHLIDYVLLHELTHTKFMHHGPAFWKELESHLPNARALKNEIDTYQPTLTSERLTVV